ncbi:Monocyte to macrophage differentiation factor [Manis javanica]|nr:Monocyte to macrophage differentiation factor [Manis javanica]
MRATCPAARAEETEFLAPEEERRINAVQESIPQVHEPLGLANGRYKPTCYEHAANCYTHALLIMQAIVGSALLHRLSDDCWGKIQHFLYAFATFSSGSLSTVELTDFGELYGNEEQKN